MEELLEEFLNRNFAGPPKPRAEAAATDQVRCKELIGATLWWDWGYCNLGAKAMV